jgi:hypothetical protein
MLLSNLIIPFKSTLPFYQVKEQLEEIEKKIKKTDSKADYFFLLGMKGQKYFLTTGVHSFKGSGNVQKKSHGNKNDRQSIRERLLFLF